MSVLTFKNPSLGLKNKLANVLMSIRVREEVLGEWCNETIRDA